MNTGSTKSAPSAPARRKRRSPEEIRERVVQAAVAEFEQVGLSGATTAAISRRADVTEAQIFRLFDSKTDLFRAAIFDPLNRHFAEFQRLNISGAGKETPTRDMARRYIDELQDFMEQHSRMLMSLITANAYAPGTTSGMGEIAGLHEYFGRGAAMMESHVKGTSPVNPDLMVRVSFASVLASVMFRDWLFPQHLGEDHAIRNAIADFVLDGIGANYGDAAQFKD